MRLNIQKLVCSRVLEKMPITGEMKENTKFPKISHVMKTHYCHIETEKYSPEMRRYIECIEN